ncbi:MAG TPA: hypothetical protein VM118_12165 [Acidobacteriota bacterium]|nr:hypothetical protein [Acidobacteriota bacterium]
MRLVRGHPGLPDMTTCRCAWWAAGILLVVLSAMQAGPAAAALPPQIVVYLDQYMPATAVMTLTLQDVSLVGEGADVPLELAPGGLSLTQPPARQVRLIDQTVPAGRYRGMRFRLSITYAMNDTTVRVDTLNTFLDMELPLDQGDIAPLFLSLHAVGTEGDEGRAVVDIEIMEARIPPFNSLLFVSNEESNNVSVIDRVAGRVVDVLTTGERPAGMTFSRFTRELFVANAGDHTVTVFDVTTRQLLRRLRLDLGDEPTRLALSPDSRFLYVLATGSNSLVVYDANSNQESGRFSLGLQAVGLAVDPVAGWVYISNELSDNISVFDPIQQMVVTTIPAGSLPTELVFVSPDNLLCAASSGQRVVTVLSSTGNLQATAGLCAVAHGLAYDRVGGTAYASIAMCNELAVFQPANGLSLGTVPLPGQPGLLTLDPENRTLLAALPEQDRIVIVNLTGNRVVAVVDVGRRPYMVVVAL